jgi:hypothetical protein
VSVLKISLVCFPALVAISLIIRPIEYVAKFLRNEKWYKSPIAVITVLPVVFSLTFYHAIRMLFVSFRQACYLKLDRFGLAERLDVEHSYSFNTARAWDAPALIDSHLDPTVESRRRSMFQKVI